MATTYSVVKTFSATKAADREALGEKVTTWMRAHPELEVVEARALQSSDVAYHCLSIVMFFRERSAS